MQKSKGTHFEITGLKNTLRGTMIYLLTVKMYDFLWQELAEVCYRRATLLTSFSGLPSFTHCASGSKTLSECQNLTKTILAHSWALKPSSPGLLTAPSCLCLRCEKSSHECICDNAAFEGRGIQRSRQPWIEGALHVELWRVPASRL